MSLISLKRSSKHSVNMCIKWEMAFLLGFVAWLWDEYELGQFVVTSASDGTHRKGSFHYSGNAVDIRTRHLFKKGKYTNDTLLFIQTLQTDFGKYGLRIFLHGYHDKGVPHLHLAYDEKKGKLFNWVK